MPALRAAVGVGQIRAIPPGLGSSEGGVSQGGSPRSILSSHNTEIREKRKGEKKPFTP